MSAWSYPDTYSGIPAEKLLEAFHAGPQRLRESLGGLDEDDLRAHPREGKWSIHEIVCHVADSEIMGAVRFRQAWTASGRRLAVYDQDVWAESLDYPGLSGQAREEQLRLFELLRRTTGRLLEKAGRADWTKSVEHPEWGLINLRQILEIYADHSERHIAQILELRRLLGKPCELTLLLPERLY